MNREIGRLAGPALLTLAADPLVSLIDTAFVGRLGTAPLAALGVNAAIFSIAFIVFNFLAYGTTPLVATAVGQGDFDRVKRTVTQALILAVVLGVVATVVLQWGARTWLELMQTPPEAVEPGLSYLRIRAFAAPAILLITAANGAFRGQQDTATPLRVTLVLNLVNLVGDALLILVFGWGIVGAAVATVAAQWVGAIWFVYLLAPQWIGLKGVRRGEMVEFLSIGWAILIRTGALLAALTAATASAARIGVEAVAAHQIVMQIWILLALTVDALAVAAQALVGRFVGEGNEGAIVATVRTLTAWGIVVGIVLGGLVLAVGPLLQPVFGINDEVAVLAIGVLPLVAALQPLGALLFVGDGVYLGASRFRLLAVSTVVASVSSISVISLLDGRRQDLLGIWAGIGVLLVVRLIPQVVSYVRHPAIASPPPARESGWQSEGRRPTR